MSADAKPFLVVRSKPRERGRESVCMPCMDSCWLELGWPQGDRHWGSDGYSASAFAEPLAVWVAEFLEPLTHERVKLAKAFFEDPPAKTDPASRHDHRRIFLSNLSNRASKILVAAWWMREAETRDDMGEWLTPEEVEAEVRATLEKVARQK